ncbi:MAG: MerR family transcriptional regulator [Saprospiraceae bacterium]|jgi:DNA-binding transcriptional MerR regulator|nr:MerR family transcriptional regulator [bacterium]MDG1435229.1 MerR family transcriptional regulator [Saprospiraceae bacterium]MDG2418581.1 MerR family transcriptional regulator [Saprospiraceae bacterium]
MSMKDKEVTKLYWSIGEVANMFDVSKSLIRFWENEFEMLRPAKNTKGERRFTNANIEQMHIIYNLVKKRGFTIKGAKQEIRENKKRLKNKREALQLMEKLKVDLEGFLLRV